MSLILEQQAKEMSAKEEVKAKKVESDQFENCPYQPLSCFHKNNSNVEICNLAPCEESKFEIAIHERIIKYYIRSEEYEEAYYYLGRLMDKSHFNCKLEELERIKRENPNPDIADLPPACRLFYFKQDLGDLLDSIFPAFEGKDKHNLGKRGGDSLTKARSEFIQIMNKCILLLDKIIKAERFRQMEEDRHHDKLLDLYDTSILAAKKYGIKVNHSMGTALEQGFEKASEKAGLKIKKHAELNQKRVKEAKKEMKMNQLMKTIKKQLIEKGEISPELQSKLNKIRAGEN